MTGTFFLIYINELSAWLAQVCPTKADAFKEIDCLLHDRFTVQLQLVSSSFQSGCATPRHAHPHVCQRFYGCFVCMLLLCGLGFYVVYKQLKNCKPSTTTIHAHGPQAATATYRAYTPTSLAAIRVPADYTGAGP